MADICYLNAEGTGLSWFSALSLKPEAAVDWARSRLHPNTGLTDPKDIAHAKRCEAADTEWKRLNLTDLKYVASKFRPEEVLGAYFTIFNDRIFGGILTGRCKLELKAPGKEWKGRILGQCDLIGSNPEDRHCIITIFEYKKGYTKGVKMDAAARLKNHLETLLHEMAHAFLDLAVCDCGACAYTCICGMCSSFCKDLLGYTGHGLIWQKLTDLIQDFVGVYFELELSVGRETAMGHEIYERYLVERQIWNDRGKFESVNLNPEKVIREATGRILGSFLMKSKEKQVKELERLKSEIRSCPVVCQNIDTHIYKIRISKSSRRSLWILRIPKWILRFVSVSHFERQWNQGRDFIDQEK